MHYYNQTVEYGTLYFKFKVTFNQSALIFCSIYLPSDRHCKLLIPGGLIQQMSPVQLNDGSTLAIYGHKLYFVLVNQTLYF